MLSSFDKDVKDRQKSNSDGESPGKIPEFIFISFKLYKITILVSMI